MTRHTDELTQTPWQLICEAELEQTSGVPTMLSPDEQRLYYWLTAHWTEDIGAVVDLGCFAGGSTARLAAGHMAAGKRQWIHAYDRFKADQRTKEAELYRKGILDFKGHDIYLLTRDLLEPWEDVVTLHRGDIMEKTWNDDPIELLIIDAAKSTQAADGIAERFFPSLIAGKSLLIHQDYFHWRLPWLPVQMQRMADWFRPVTYCPNGTMVFQNIRPVDDEALAAGRLDNLTDEELLDSLTQVAPMAQPWHRQRIIAKMKRTVQANPGIRRAYSLRDPDAQAPNNT